MSVDFDTDTASGPAAGASRVQAVTGAAEFLRRLRSGLDDGLDPMSAAERAATSLPKTLRDSVDRVSRRMSGRYHED